MELMFARGVVEKASSEGLGGGLAVPPEVGWVVGTTR